MHWVDILIRSMNGDGPGKHPKPPITAPKGYKQLRVAEFLKPSNRTASEKKAAEGEAAMAHAERVAGDSAAQAEWDAAAKKRKPGRPSKLASGISSRGAGPLLGRKHTKWKKHKLSDKRKPKPIYCLHEAFHAAKKK